MEAPVCLAAQPLIGENASMQAIHTYIKKVAAESHVLITGETGTGKELVAEQIHRYSSRLC
jgi:DNA-binding NtrC family response regulator